MEKSIIIIGAGLTGLSAGCYGQLNGYKTTIFEMHDKAGGVCTAWKRKGYTIDGAMNWLVGTGKKSEFYSFWEELGAAKDWKIYNHDRYMVDEDKDGNVLTIYCDADRFEDYLVEMAPEDEEAIKEFTGAIRAASNRQSPVDRPPELMDAPGQMAGALPEMQLIQKWASITTHGFARGLNNPNLRRCFLNLPDMPMIMFVWVLGFQHAKSAGYVLGGALALVESVEKRYRELGGEIHFDSKVVEILVKDVKAVGVKLAGGKEYRADYVISAGDGRTAIYDLLGGRHVDEQTANMYRNPALFEPLVYVALGVKDTFEDVPTTIGGLRFALRKPLNIAGKEEHSMNVLIYNFDPSLAPDGSTVVVVQYPTSFDYWQALRKNLPEYKAEKARIADAVVSGLEQRFPGISRRIEMRDVATPVTWERYTGNWRGAYEGWQFGAAVNISKTLPGLDNFYMAGQWVNPGGGMPTAAMSGSHTIQFICKRDGKEFVTK